MLIHWDKELQYSPWLQHFALHSAAEMKRQIHILQMTSLIQLGVVIVLISFKT